MKLSLGEKIEAIRQEPEHVRMRYVMLCVSVSMVFIVAIWLLSVSESVTSTAKDLPQALEASKQGVTGTPSLNDLFEQAAPLRIEEKGLEGSQFFDQAISGREQGKSEANEGMAVPQTEGQ